MNPSGVKVPSDVPTCKMNLFRWLSKSVDYVNDKDQEGIIHCWAQTELLCAWDSSTQVEAIMRRDEIFKQKGLNSKHGDKFAEDVAPDESDADAEAFWPGVPFMEAEEDEDWMEWVDWGSV